MRIYGYFDSQKGDTFKVVITMAGNTGADMEIEPDGDLQFADEDIVVIDSGSDDSLDVVRQHTCSIALQARKYVDCLFAKEYKDAKVEIGRVTSGYGTDAEALECVFSGWLEPRTLSQPFNDVYDDLTLQCVDCLSAMQYSPFRGVGVSETYAGAAREAGMTTFRALLIECLAAGCGGMDGYNVFYDGSKALDGAEGADGIFAGLSVSDMIFLGDDADDTKTCLEVAEAVLKYLNLHAVQYGRSLYVFSWETVRKGAAAWTDMRIGSGTAAAYAASGTTTLSTDNVEDDRAQIDVTEIFNQVSLTVSPKKDGAALVMPFDSDGKFPVMGPRRPYITEFAADGEGTRAARCFWGLASRGKNPDSNGKYSEEQVYKDYYVRVLRNARWLIGSGGADWAEAQAASDNTRPNTAVSRLSRERGALLLSIGAVDHKAGKGDNSRQTTISMSDWLVISVNGNGSDDGPLPGEAELRGMAPVAVYTGGSVGASYSPAEEGAENYLVIDGSLILNPVMAMSDSVADVRSYADADAFAAGHSCGTVPSRNNGDGRFLTFGWWLPGNAADAYFPSQSGYSLTGVNASDMGWIPYTGDGPEQYEYKNKGGDDTVSKVGILECMLIIGDGDGAMVLVEDQGENGDADGAMDKLSWQKYKTLAGCGNDEDAYYAQSFSIGIDPKIGDKIIGTEFNIATNFDYSTNISAEGGMAIPLPHSAGLRGKITLKILGPVNEYWADNVKRHRTWFRKEKWTTTAVPLMAHVSSIIVKSLSIKMYTATADLQDDADTDLVYASNVSHGFYNKKDGLQFDIHSGFTQAEIAEYGLTDAVLRGTVTGGDGLPLLEVRDANTGETAKPEKIYVDAAYNELHLPRIVLTQNVRYCGGNVNPFSLYRHAALSRDFYVRDMGLNLSEGSAQLRLEECF